MFACDHRGWLRFLPAISMDLVFRTCVASRLVLFGRAVLVALMVLVVVLVVVAVAMVLLAAAMDLFASLVVRSGVLTLVRRLGGRRGWIGSRSCWRPMRLGRRQW